MEKKKLPSLLAGPALFFIFLILRPFGLDYAASCTIGTIAWMLVWWISEALPMGATSLLPIIIFPLTGIMSIEKTCIAYGNKFVFLFLGGFIIAIAMEKWQLHRRIALNIVNITGTGANNIIFGFLLSSFLISMWISNTATTLMMFPIATSIVAILIKKENNHLSKGEKNFSLTLMLSIAYGSSIGGIATLVGSPPNAAAAGILSSDSFNAPITFFDWFKIGFPFALALMLLTYFFLVKIIYPNRLGKFEEGTSIIQEELKKLGKPTTGELRVFVVFVATALLWILADPISTLLKPYGVELSDVVVSMIAAVALFIIPSSASDKKPLLDWKDTERLPWGVLLMFGGGLAMAEAFKNSGLIEQVTSLMKIFESGNMFVFVSILCFTGIILTALMSNLAMVNIFVPVVAALALGAGIHPAIFAIPVAISSSCDFMFPMSTPPNAIAYSSGYVKASQMLKSGIVINLVSFILLMIVVALTL